MFHRQKAVSACSSVVGVCNSNCCLLQLKISNKIKKKKNNSTLDQPLPNSSNYKHYNSKIYLIFSIKSSSQTCSIFALFQLFLVERQMVALDLLEL